MMTLLILFVIQFVLVSLVAFECWRQFINHTKLKNFVVLNGLPVFGHLLDLIICDTVKIYNFPKQLLAKYKLKTELAFVWMGPVLILCTDEPNAIETILKSDKALKKSYMYNFLRNTNGIFTSFPDVWKVHRRALNPTLGQRMIDTFYPIFNEKSKIMVDLMEQQIGENVDMHRIAFKATVDSIFKTSFDIDWPMQNETGDKLRNNIMAMFHYAQTRAQSWWLQPSLFYRFSNLKKEEDQVWTPFFQLVHAAFVAKNVDLDEKLTHGYDELENAKRRNSFNYLQKCFQMKSENKFTDKDIFEEMQTILVGGSDTTAITITSTILMLAVHQHYQDRVVDELRSIFTDVDEPVTKEHASKMEFLELVIKEALRLYPIAPFLGREITEDLPMLGGIVPKGTQVILNISATHRNPLYWGEDAHEFKPERMRPENCINHHPFQYVPFSAGPRNCIGIRYGWASLKIALAYLLRRYKFTTDLKMKEIKVRAGLITKIVNKDPVRIERREWQ